jgi:hypothetical protein
MLKKILYLLKLLLMKNFYAILLITCSLYACGQENNGLGGGMDKLKTNTVLIVKSQAIDEYPLWSPNSDFVACNIQGKWFKFDLTQIDLEKASWYGYPIALAKTEAKALNSKELQKYMEVSEFSPREVKTKDSTKIETRRHGRFTFNNTR